MPQQEEKDGIPFAYCKTCGEDCTDKVGAYLILCVLASMTFPLLMFYTVPLVLYHAIFGTECDKCVQRKIKNLQDLQEQQRFQNDFSQIVTHLLNESEN